MWIKEFFAFQSLLDMCEQPMALERVIIMLLGLLIWSMSVRQRHLQYVQSMSIFNEIKSLFSLSSTECMYLFKILPRIHQNKPHLVLSSLGMFDKTFLKIMVFVDRKRRFNKYKSNLLHFYSKTRKVLESLINKRPRTENDRRLMIRFRCVKPVIIYGDKVRKKSQEGLLLNISGGGLKFFTTNKITKGQKINVAFAKQQSSAIAIKVLDVLDKQNYSIVRAQYAWP